ncbi:hypothetical protein GW933_00370 [Candidatus Falkowbacteria bacterium]|nr:hypothetical protein [Candidatus Falkowbacteria bacterium]
MVSCFVGGFFGTLVAIVSGVGFWWLGLLVGFSTGYLSYEFHQVLAAIPIFWKSTVNVFSKTVWPKLVRLYKYDEPRPFLLVGFSSFVFITTYLFRLSPDLILDNLVTILGLSLFLAVFIAISVCFIACAGADIVEKVYWEGTMIVESSLLKSKKVDLTYARTIRWFLEGLIALPLLVVFFVIASFLLLCSPLIFLVLALIMISWEIIKYIYSDERLTCGFSGAIGVLLAISYLFYNPNLSWVEAVILMVSIGVISCTIGVISWKVFQSKKTNICQA